MKESPIFVKTKEFMKYCLPITARFSRSRRYSLTMRIENGCLEFYEQLISCVKFTGNDKIVYLKKADVILETLRFEFRLAMELKELSIKSYGTICKYLKEIGELLGAWIAKEMNNSYRLEDRR